MSLVWVIAVVVCDIVAVLSSMLWLYYQDVHELCHIQHASMGSGANVWQLHKVTSILYYNHVVQTCKILIEENRIGECE